MTAPNGLGTWLLTALAATVTLTAVTEPAAGVVVLLVRPAMLVAVSAGLVMVAAGRSQRLGGLAPLAAALGPLVAAPAAGTWSFAGAGALILWALVAAAMIRARLPITIALPRPRLHAAAAMLAATCWLGGIAAAVAPFALTGDAPHYLTIARSLASDGDLDLRDDYDRRDYADFYAGSLEPRHTNTSPWGEQYPFHGIGVAVLVAPWFAWFGVAGATATLVLVMAGGSALLWLAAWQLLRDAAAAWFGWATLVLAAPYALHAAAIYPDGPAAAGVAAALWLAVRLQVPGAPVPLWQLVAGSVGLAALPWLHARLALPAAVMGLSILTAIWRGQPDRSTRVAWFLAVPAVSLAGWVGAAQVMFGTWNPSAAILQRTAPGGIGDMTKGLLGLMADHQYGLLPAAPVMAAAAWAAVGFTRAFPLLGAASGAATLGVLVMASFWVWWGGDSAPARFLAVTLPAQSLWLAWLWSRAGRGARRVLIIALAVTAAMTLLYATVDGGARAYAFADGRGSVFEAFSTSVDLSLAMPSLFRPGETFGLTVSQAIGWLTAMAGAAWLASRLPAALSEGTATGLGGAIVVLAAGLAAQAGWWMSGAVPWTPGAAALALVQDASQRGIAATRLDSLRLRPLDDVLHGVRLRTVESIPLRPPVLLYVPNLPAGVYDVHTEGGAGSSAPLRLELGREAWTFATWAASETAPSIELPAALHSLRVLGEPAPGVRVWIEPRHLARSPSPGTARRGTGYGDLVVFSMDDDSYPEATGLWTGGDRSTRLLVTALRPRPGPVVARVEAGPVPLEVTLSTASQTERVVLEARATADVQLAWPADAAPIDLRVGVRGGFPASAIGLAADSRTLGAWLALSPAPDR